MTDGVSSASDEFKLSITRALADQLLVKLSGLIPVALTAENVAALEPRPGVYELFRVSNGGDNERVYVGKARENLRHRLDKHRRKLSGRAGISLTEVHFKCLYVDEDLEAAAPEKMLISRYRPRGDIPWKTNGFGNNDPGRKRDDSLVKANHFDAEYPANLDFVLDSDVVEPGEYTVRKFLTKVKTHLPFNLRFEDKTTHSTEYARHHVNVPSSDLTVRDVITLAIDARYVILYREDFEYESARCSWRKRGGQTRELAGKNRRDEAGEVHETESDDD